MTMLSVGHARDESLPPDRLTPDELAELRRLCDARAQLEQQLETVSQRLELVVIAARDRRGIAGPVIVDAREGRIRADTTANGRDDAD